MATLSVLPASGPPKIITYCLRNDKGDVNPFHEALSALGDEFIEASAKTVGELVREFRRFQAPSNQSLKGGGPAPQRPQPEPQPESRLDDYLDLLTLGVLVPLYGRPLERPAKGLLPWLTAWARKDLDPGESRDATEESRPPDTGEGVKASFDVADIHRLLAWLKREEWEAEAARLKPWRDFLGQADPGELRRWTREITQLAGWFRNRARRRLGPYTVRVNHFLENEKHRGRYDETLRTLPEVVYHLAMLAVEIVNRVERQAFLETQDRIVILPQCMRAKEEGECLARPTPIGPECAGCTKECRVNQITRLGREAGFKTYLSGELVDLPGGDVARPGTGVVGVACPIPLAMEFRRAKKLGILAQGVFLDYCGCRHHWDPEGFPTETNEEKLLQVVDRNPPVRSDSGR